MCNRHPQPEVSCVVLIRCSRPVRLPIGQYARKHGAPIRKFNPGLEPAIFVYAHHDASLIVERLEITLDAHFGGEGFRCLKAEKMSIVADKAVMSFAPEVGRIVSYN